MLLFQSSAWYENISQEELQRLVDQNKAWINQLSEQNKIKGGQALVRDRAVVSKKGKVVTDGPFAESKEAIGGFLVVQADSLEEAIEIAKTSPSLVYDTTIEVRPVAESCPLEGNLAKRLEKNCKSNVLKEAACSS